jgi:hypothetical protein
MPGRTLHVPALLVRPGLEEAGEVLAPERPVLAGDPLELHDGLPRLASQQADTPETQARLAEAGIGGESPTEGGLRVAQAAGRQRAPLAPRAPALDAEPGLDDGSGRTPHRVRRRIVPAHPGSGLQGDPEGGEELGVVFEAL